MGNKSNKKRGLNLNNIAVWVAIITIASGIITSVVVGGRWLSRISVQLNNIGVIDERLNKKIQLINENHEDIDALKIEVKEADHALELKIKDETIARQKTEIEFYKNK